MAFGLLRRKTAPPIEIGARAAAILESDAWQEAWAAYRDRLFSMIEAAPADDASQVMHLKSLLSSAHQCRHHLEALVSEGRLEQERLNALAEQDRRSRSVVRMPHFRTY